MLEVSVIIPCYRDEAKLAQLLAQLQALPQRPAEVIVVDGAVTPTCRETCLQYGACWLPSEPCRGRQLLTGAELAAGKVFWFLHADARLSEDPLRAIHRALDGGAVGGYFRFRFDAPRAWPAWLLETAIALRCRFGVPYGDQGLFMTEAAYRRAGGHAPWPLFEEVPLVRGLRRLGRFAALRELLYVDPRRWHRDGWWQRSLGNRRLALAFACGVSPEKLAQRYRARHTVS
jgi:rSAM/selenodomain-associated transferase 2